MKELIIKTTQINQNGFIIFESLNLKRVFKTFIEYKFYIFDKYGIDLELEDFYPYKVIKQNHKNYHNSSQEQVHESDKNRNTNKYNI